MNFRKLKKNFRKDMRAISPVIATLLMIAIAVVASLVVYAWVMGYMSFTTTKTGKAIQIQSVSNNTGYVSIYVQNVGDSAVKIDAAQGIYINGTLMLTGGVPGSGFTGVVGTAGTLAPSSTGELRVNTPVAQINPPWVPQSGQTAYIKLTTIDGTQTQFTWYVP